jgi:putative endonuclease
VLQNLSPNHKSSLGRLGEDIAASYLVRNGYTILDRNFKARYGELDIVALQKNTLVCVEVKTRINRAYGYPEEAVTPRKLHEVIQTLQLYKQLHPNLPDSMRIDVIGIILDEDTNSVKYFRHLVSVTS